MAYFRHRVVNGGQFWVGVVREVDVIEADDSQLIWNFNTFVVCNGNRTRGHLVVGVGTVTNPEELAAAAAAGAQFAISPGITDELLTAAKASSMPLIPGIATISELMQAKALGYTHFKFFPAEASGGVAMLKSIAGPFPNVRFCPTGGIHQGNYRDYLALNNVACVGGSWILPAAAIQAKDWAAIEKLAKEAVQQV